MIPRSASPRIQQPHGRISDPSMQASGALRPSASANRPQRSSAPRSQMEFTMSNRVRFETDPGPLSGTSEIYGIGRTRTRGKSLYSEELLLGRKKFTLYGEALLLIRRAGCPILVKQG